MLVVSTMTSQAMRVMIGEIRGEIFALGIFFTEECAIGNRGTKQVKPSLEEYLRGKFR